MTDVQPQETVQLPAHLQAGSDPDLPTGGEFGRGYIANITTNVCYTLYSADDLAVEYMSRRQVGQGFRYYFATRDHGMAGIKAAGLAWTSPPRSFVIGFSGADVINYRSDDPEKESEFRQSQKISEIDLVTLASKKKHALAPMQLIQLPAMVYAMATMLKGMSAPGFVQPDGQPISLLNSTTLEPLFNVDMLLGNDWILNDETQAALVGNADIGYKGSKCWLGREALWEVLGENDARKWLRIGTQTSKGRRASGTTDSPLLSTCLAGIKSWQGYARVAWCTDPRVGEMYKNPKWSAETTDQPEMLARRFLLVTDMYHDLASAQAAVIEELGELPMPGVQVAGGAANQQPVTVAATQPAAVPQQPVATAATQPQTVPIAVAPGQQPAIPSVWSTIPADFMTQARATFAAEGDNAQAATALAISLPEAIAWRNYLNSTQPTG